MAYGKIQVDEVENSNGDTFDLSHSSLVGTNDAGSHPASAIVADDGNTVQSHLNKVAITQVSTTDALKNTDLTDSLSVGDFVQTLGYYSVGDGGGNTFEIVDAATGTDDGGSYIDLTGGTMQAKGLFVHGPIDPAMFGAIPSAGSMSSVDTDADATTAITNALSYWIADGENKTCDFRGRPYAISDSITIPGGSLIGAKRLTNGTLLAKSSYSSSVQMIDFSNQTLRKNSSIDNMTFLCGNSDGANAPGALLFGDFSGMTIDSINAEFFSGSCIQATGTGAAGESRMVNCIINGGRTSTGEDCIGVEWDKGDCEFSGNVIRLCKYNMYFRASAIIVSSNHLWCSDDYVDDYNIYAEKSEGSLITNNYIDNGRVVLYAESTAPRRINLDNNKWVLKPAKAASWVTSGYGWIELGCNSLGTGEARTPRDISIQGNMFGSRDDSDQVEIPLIVTVGDGWPTEFTYPGLHNVIIKNNTFPGNQYVKGSEITKAVSFTSQSSVSFDLSNYRFNENWDFVTCISTTLQTSSDAYIKNVRYLSDEWVVYLSGEVSGTLAITVDANSFGTSVDDFGVPV